MLIGSRCEQGNIETTLAGSTPQLQVAIHWRKAVGRGKVIGQTALIVRADQRQALSAADITAALSHLHSTQWHEVTSLAISCHNLDKNLSMHQLAEGAWPALRNFMIPIMQLYPADLDLSASAFPVTLQHLSIGGFPAANLHSMLTTTAIAWPVLSSLHLNGFRFTLSCSKLLFCNLLKLECLKLHTITFDSRDRCLSVVCISRHSMRGNNVMVWHSKYDCQR